MTGQGLVNWRQRNNLSQEAAARLLGWSRASVLRYENGNETVPVYIALAIAALEYGLPPYPDNGGLGAMVKP